MLVVLTELIPLRPLMLPLDVEITLLLVNDIDFDEATSLSIGFLVIISVPLLFWISRKRLTFSLSLTPKIYYATFTSWAIFTSDSSIGIIE